MEKVTFSRTDISEDVLLQLAKTSELIKRLNSLTLVNYIQKQEIVKELFGSSGSNVTLARISMSATISMLIIIVRCSTLQKYTSAITV